MNRRWLTMKWAFSVCRVNIFDCHDLFKLVLMIFDKKNCLQFRYLIKSHIFDVAKTEFCMFKRKYNRALTIHILFSSLSKCSLSLPLSFSSAFFLFPVFATSTTKHYLQFRCKVAKHKYSVNYKLRRPFFPFFSIFFFCDLLFRNASHFHFSCMQIFERYDSTVDTLANPKNGLPVITQSDAPIDFCFRFWYFFLLELLFLHIFNAFLPYSSSLIAT